MPKNDTNVTAKTVLAEYLEAFAGLQDTSFLDSMDRVVQVFNAARDMGATIYIAGNGGSASTASHWVNDMGKATKKPGRLPMKVMSLSDNVSWLTALGNDEGYDRVFSGQLENFAAAGDVLVVISASGNSPNLLRVVEMAQTHGLTTVALLGFDGGALKNMVDEYLLFPTPKGAYGLVESGHSMMCHILTTCLTERSGGKLDSDIQESSAVVRGA